MPNTKPDATFEDVQIDDLILFFYDKNNDAVCNRWIPRSLYTNHSLKFDPTSDQRDAWEGCALRQMKTEGGSFVIADLNELLPPDEAPHAPHRARAKQMSPTKTGNPSVIAPGDLIISPFQPQSNDGSKADWYRIPHDVYANDCPAVAERDIADLQFMADQEGVLVASVPKLELTGCTCYLLSLVSLRSSAIEEKADKTKQARLFRTKLEKKHPKE